MSTPEKYIVEQQGDDGWWAIVEEATGRKAMDGIMPIMRNTPESAQAEADALNRLHSEAMV